MFGSRLAQVGVATLLNLYVYWQAIALSNHDLVANPSA